MRYFVLFLILFNTGCMNKKCKMPGTITQKSVAGLNTVLHNEQKFIKVHAAEFLLWLNSGNDEVKKVFLKENEQFGNEPKYRIGIWRVLAQASTNETEKKEWIEKVMNVFTDTTAPDRIHAAETLAKLKTSPLSRFPEITTKTLNDSNNILSVYTMWATSYTSKKEEENNKTEFINYLFTSADTTIRKISAYVLAKSKNLSVEEWETLADKALQEPAASPLKQTYLNTAFVTFAGGNTEKHRRIKEELINGYKNFTAEQRIGLCQSLADSGGCEDAAIAISYLDNENSEGLYEPNSPLAADVRAYAAYAILKINNRK